MQVLPVGQRVPQAPQFSGSVAVVVQPPEQTVWPAVHAATQRPELHTEPAAQRLLQAPQFIGS
jgi:hypothetical protein